MAGWIKISRDIVNHWVWANESWRAWWLDLLMLAAWEDKDVMYEGERIHLSRGQIYASISFYAKRWNTNNTAVYRFFKHLEDDDMITRADCSLKKEMKKEVKKLTICNYETYQGGVKKVVKKVVKKEKEEIPTPPEAQKKGDDHERKNEESERYAKFRSWVSTNAPWCYNNLKMITEVQFYILMKTYTPQEVSETILELENYCKRDKYKDLYLTVRQWLRKRDGTAI